MMLITLRKRTAQSTLEYAVLAVVVIGALLSIQVFLKRSIQGKIQSSASDISETQYDPDKTTYNKTTITSSKTQEISTKTGSSTMLLDDEKTTVNLIVNTDKSN